MAQDALRQTWGGERLLPEGWLEIATEPSPTNNQYGCATAEPHPLLARY